MRIILTAFLLVLSICNVVYGQQRKANVTNKQGITPVFRCDTAEKKVYLYIINNKYIFHTVSVGDVVKTIDPNDIISIAVHPHGDIKNAGYAKNTGKYSSRVLDVLVMETKAGVVPKALKM